MFVLCFGSVIYIEWHFQGASRHNIDTSLCNQENVLTAHVLLSLKMGALCNADMTAMTAWRLFMSHSFFKKKKKKGAHNTLSWADAANTDKNTMVAWQCPRRCVPWRCECRDSTPRLGFSTSARGESLVPPRNSSRKEKHRHKYRIHFGKKPRIDKHFNFIFRFSDKTKISSESDARIRNLLPFCYSKRPRIL